MNVRKGGDDDFVTATLIRKSSSSGVVIHLHTS